MKSKNLKLNVLASENLSKVELNQVKGGTGCGCGCCYEENGGSSTDANGEANAKGGKSSTGCTIKKTYLPEVVVSK
jgi:natural product precursor